MEMNTSAWRSTPLYSNGIFLLIEDAARALFVPS